MYRYVGDISNISHNIITSYISGFHVAIDGTLGNGYDTDFLCSNFEKVYSFDIQMEAIHNYTARKPVNVDLICDSHENFKTYINGQVDCIMYNLGFLPGGDKTVTTRVDSTIKSVKDGLVMLNPGGIMSIAVYTGHEEGKKEGDALLDLIRSLPKKNYGVLLHTFINRENSPMLIIIERNSN